MSSSEKLHEVLVLPYNCTDIAASHLTELCVERQPSGLPLDIVSKLLRPISTASSRCTTRSDAMAPEDVE